MRTFTLVRDLLVMLACVCVVLLTVEIFWLEARVAKAVTEYQQQTRPTFELPTADPEPYPTRTGD